MQSGLTCKRPPIIRSTATHLGIPCYTTMSGAATVVNAIEATRAVPIEVRALQDYHAKEKNWTGSTGSTG